MQRSNTLTSRCVIVVYPRFVHCPKRHHNSTPFFQPFVNWFTCSFTFALEWVNVALILHKVSSFAIHYEKWSESAQWRCLWLLLSCALSLVWQIKPNHWTISIISDVSADFAGSRMLCIFDACSAMLKFIYSKLNGFIGRTWVAFK